MQWSKTPLHAQIAHNKADSQTIEQITHFHWLPDVAKDAKCVDDVALKLISFGTDGHLLLLELLGASLSCPFSVPNKR